MARELDEKDLEILKKLAPELESLICSGSGVEFQSILPPLANHIAMGGQDFVERLRRLSEEEMRYLSERILDGSESLGCLEPEYAELFFQVLGMRLSEEAADKVREAYESGGVCDL